ncbi:aminotransferase class I/II-fold pyridoxal phosphate-dependent enzyme [Candidatus Peregrinibacteria bacterium]|nr:aminotransferase class I/II-fold pyridoxal phosphate-dependent enzyme [Candidatus Peregrinibacteria bacterium]
MLFSPIHHTFAPLGDRRQCVRALLMLFAPWKYRSGESRDILREHLRSAFGAEAFLFSSGRTGLLAVLRAMKLQTGDEVIVQGYTCVVVPNAIHAAGGCPVYVDLDPDTLNLDPEETSKAITPRTRAVICQHTFGIPADTERLRALCDQHNIMLIEDCAHSIPDEGGPKEIGRHGDVLLLSFGRDKAISGVSGGAILCRNADLSAALDALTKDTKEMSCWMIARLLCYPLLYGIARPFYGLGIGKVWLKIMSLTRFLIPILTKDEKQGHMPPIIDRMPNALAFLALDQWHRLGALNDHRRLLTRFYLEEGKKRMWLRALPGITPDLPLQKFPLFLRNADHLRTILRRRNIHLSDGWTGCVVCPATVNIDQTHYRPGTGLKAEMACRQILSLPTHPTMTLKQAKQLIQEIEAILSFSQH